MFMPVSLLGSVICLCVRGVQNVEDFLIAIHILHD
jgi:hypothetical protein